MRWPQILRLRLRALVKGRAADRDLRDELDAHLAYLIDEHVARGLSPADAQHAALRDFGVVARLQEDCREARGITSLSILAQDVAYGFRLLRRAPAFTVAAVLTLALGMGASTAIFSIVYSVILRPLPFRDPDALVALWTAAPTMGLPRAFVGAANARDWRAQNDVFEGIALVRAIGNFNLTGAGEPERLQGALVSSNLLDVLGVTPMLGRGFTDEEDEIGHDGVVLLSHAVWTNRFGADASVIGRTVTLNGSPVTIVGVMRPDFHYPSREFQIWRPLSINPADYITRANFGFLAVARLKRGATLDQARAEMDVISRRLEDQYPDTNKDIGVVVEPLLADTVAAVRRPLFVLLAAVSAMLVIGCVNLANLVLTRALTRRRELAVRAALGAGRRRLLMQSVAEILPTFAIGGALGLLLAQGILDVLVPLMPSDMPRVETVALHLPVLMFSISVLAVVAVVTGLWPALALTRDRQTTPVAELTRAITAPPDRARVRDLLVVAQVAMTLLLLVTAALLIRSFAAIKDVEPGFRSARVLSAHLAIPRSKYRTDRAVADFCRRLIARVSVLPGVEAAGMVNRLPFAGGVQNGFVSFEGADPAIGSDTDWRMVTPDYFRALDIAVVAGRAFTDADTDTAPAVGIIDDRLAQVIWGEQDVVGRRFRVAREGAPWVTIVGVVRHIRHDSLEADSRPQVYWNYLQRAQDRMALVVKTRGDPAAFSASIVAVVRSIDPDQPVYDVRSLDAVVDRSVARRWLQTTLLAVFAGFALLLATIGVYGVISYAVSQRLREFGIRLALGADRRDIVAMVVRRATHITLVGLALGIVGATAASRVMTSLLFAVAPLDAVSFATSTALLGLVALTASYLPARRAARVDPTLALRSE